MDDWLKLVGLGEIGSDFNEGLRNYVPNLVGALLLLLLGWGFAHVARALIRRLVKATMDGIARSVTIARVLEHSDLPQRIPRWTGGIVYWVIFLFFIAAAADRLELAVFTALLSGVASFLPRLLVGILIVIASMACGNLAYGTVTTAASKAGLRDPSFLGRSVQILLLIMGFVIGAEQIGVESTLLTVLVTTLVGIGLGGVALAFGLGSGPAVSNMISAHYLLEAYRPGQRVRIGEMEGRIMEITRTNVLLDSREGRVLVPARKFSEEASILLTEEN